MMKWTMKDVRRLHLRVWGTAIVLLSTVYCAVSPNRLLGADGNNSTDHGLSTPASHSVGCPLAPGMISLLEDEVNEGLKLRGIEPNFAQFTRYAASTLDNTADREQSG